MAMREDVIKYRETWANKMIGYSEFMSSFEGDDMLEIQPNLPIGTKKIVQVTHDECAFYANDGVKMMWLEEDETVLRKKDPEKTIMVRFC